MARGRKTAVKVPVVTMDMLEKEKVRVPSFKEETQILAKDAADILGYKVMQAVVATKRPLAKALRKLHIRAFTPESVKEYQDKKRLEVQRAMRAGYLSWNVVDLPSYDKPVPEFVLRKAIQIKEEVPSVQFAVEELTKDPDPFLWAFTKNERFCVEVWNEPEFEDKVLNGLVPTLNIGGDEEDDEEEE